jgi:aldose 1-epimerase
MAFHVEEQRRAFPLKPQTTVWAMQDREAGCGVEIAPEMGGNCYRWYIAEAGRPVELLYRDPEIFPGSRPTRSGIPVLFPFPNRIQGGRFQWHGKTYQLPLNDSTGKNAIHGFACRSPWRSIGSAADAQSARLTMEFQASVDAAASLAHWPADHRLTLTVRLFRDRLRLEATINNPDRVPLPFGLGYHPYFHLSKPDTEVIAPARSFWQLQDSLPTGTRLPVDQARDLNCPRFASALSLDDILTDLPADRVNTEGLVLRGRCGRVEIWTSSAFRELVAFTPAHRQGFCLEPYTCTTDAINLQQRGVDAGLLVLEPSETWSAIVELVVTTP